MAWFHQFYIIVIMHCVMAMNKWCSTVIAMLRHAFLASLNVLLSSGIVLLCISICTLYRLLPVASFWLLYYCVGFAVSLRDSCVLFSDCAHGHARYQDIMRRDQLWLGNVCFVTFWLNTSSSKFCNHDWRSICCRHGRDRANVVYDWTRNEIWYRFQESAT